MGIYYRTQRHGDTEEKVFFICLCHPERSRGVSHRTDTQCYMRCLDYARHDKRE